MGCSMASEAVFGAAAAKVGFIRLADIDGWGS